MDIKYGILYKSRGNKVNKQEYKENLEGLKTDVAYWERNTPSCKNCDDWRPGKQNSGRCSKWDAVPPQDVIETGCDEWTFDEVPF